MGLFSTLLYNTAVPTSSSSPYDATTGITASGKTKAPTAITTGNSSTSTTTMTTGSTNSNTTNLPTIIQLYTKHPIPILAVDTSIVANDVLAFHQYSDATASTTGSTTGSPNTAAAKSLWMKKFQNNTNMNAWLTPTTTSISISTTGLSSFAPLQYYAVQCISHQDYGYNHEKVPFHTQMASTNTTLSHSNVLPTSSSSLTTTTSTSMMMMTLRNSNTSKKQWYDMATKYLIPDLGIYHCPCLTSTSSSSSSVCASSTTDAMLPLTIVSSSNTTTNNTTTPVFCMVVDMSTPSQFGHVETTITTIQQALIRFLIRHSDPTFMLSKNQPSHSTSSSSSTTTTTSLYQLKHVTFGLANEDTSTTPTTTKDKTKTTTKEDMDDTNIGITLQIGVILEQHYIDDDDETNASIHGDTATTTTTTTTTSMMDYPIQQQQHLLMYHLRKYAAALNATLVFIHTDLSTTASSFPSLTKMTTVTTMPEVDANTTTTTTVLQKQPTIHVRELPWIWKALANQQPIWTYNTIEAVESGGHPNDTTTTLTSESIPPVLDDATKTTDDSNNNDKNNMNSNIYSYIYGPENHNGEWIESVLLRNANYPGHWDATKDSIWNALPSNDAATTIPLSGKNTKSSTTTKNEPTGDQLWLKELYDSIVPVMSSSHTNATPTTNTTTTTSTMSNHLQTPLPSNKTAGPSSSSLTSNSKTKTPNDAAVSSFFEDLLK